MFDSVQHQERRGGKNFGFKRRWTIAVPSLVPLLASLVLFILPNDYHRSHSFGNNPAILGVLAVIIGVKEWLLPTREESLVSVK
jgi:multisubunit Na+/H+ antiporter MnhG subunit